MTGTNSKQALSMTLYGDISLSLFSVNQTGKMNIVLGDNLEERFRRTVFESKGMRKGNISAALEEAVEAWIQQQVKLARRGK